MAKRTIKKRVKSSKVWEPPPRSWSQALQANNLLFVSGQVAVNTKGNLVGRGNAEVQARQVFKNIKNLVQEAGGTMNDVVMITVYVTDIRHSEKVRKARGAFFRGIPPTSTLLVVSGLASEDLLVEISAIAVLPE
jgi:reactive intermediate/imine deaminase